MEEWKEYKIGDLCKITSSKRIFAKEYKDSGIPFYRGKEIIEKQKGNKISTELFISQERYDEIKNKYGVPQSGDLLLTSVGTLGIPYIVKDETFYFKDGNLTWFYDFKNLDCRFLYYWFLSPIGKGNIDSKAIGSTQKALTIDTLLKFEISIPSLPTQQKIASILSSLDDKIEVNRRINEQLEELAQALFKSWFVDFEPFKDGDFVESELGMIPKGWKVGKYTDMVEIKGGGTPKTDIPEYWNGEIPFFTPKDVNNNVYCIETEKNISELGLSKCSSKLYNKNTVFITARGTVGKVCMAGRNMAMNQTCYALLGKENYGQHFIYLQTINIVERMKKKANGAVFSAITTRDFDSEKIVIPPIEIVRNFSPKIESIYESILRNQQEIRHLTTLRDTLLPKLMSGEIDVNEVEL